MAEADYGYDCMRLRGARERAGLTVPEIAAAADLSERAVSLYLAGTRRPRAPALPRLARAVGLAEPLDLCDVWATASGSSTCASAPGRAAPGSPPISAGIPTPTGPGSSPDEPETRCATPRPGRATPTSPTNLRCRSSTGTCPNEAAESTAPWRPPAYGPLEYGHPSSFFVFEAPPSASTWPSNEPRQTSPRSSKNCYMTDLPFTALSL